MNFDYMSKTLNENLPGIKSKCQNIGCMTRPSSKPAALPVVARRFASAFGALPVRERSQSRSSNLRDFT